MFASSHSNFYYAGRWTDTFIRNNYTVFTHLKHRDTLYKLILLQLDHAQKTTGNSWRLSKKVKALNQECAQVRSYIGQNVSSSSSQKPSVGEFLNGIWSLAMSTDQLSDIWFFSLSRSDTLMAFWGHQHAAWNSQKSFRFHIVTAEKTNLVNHEKVRPFFATNDAWLGYQGTISAPD